MLLPTTINLDPIIVPGVETVPYDVRQEIAPEHRDAEVLVVWGAPAARLRAAATELPRLRWVATLAAGTESIVEAGFREEVVLTSGVSLDGIDALLPTADALVMILPSLPSTRNTLDAARLARLPRHAWLVNVGRGDTVDEAALVDALRAGVIAGAALDVFASEPLPGDSALWGLPNVIVSPHAGGGRPMGAEQLLTENLEAMLAGRPLRSVVERG